MITQYWALKLQLQICYIIRARGLTSLTYSKLINVNTANDFYFALFSFLTFYSSLNWMLLA